LAISTLADAAGETIIPRNYGNGPGNFTINLRVSKTVAG